MSSPQMGSVRELPKDSVPIDFAYGNPYQGGGKGNRKKKVNGRMVPLTTKLKTGDQVEIITSAPIPLGLARLGQLVKTHKARVKIKQFFKTRTRNSLWPRSELVQ